MNLFLIITFLTTLILTTSQRTRCESFCKFRFCANLLLYGPRLQRENRALLLGVPNAALGPIPCLVQPSGTIRLLSNVTGGEARVSREFTLDPYVPISRFASREVDQSFPMDFFKWVDNESNGRQSVSRRVPKANQEAVIDGVCVRMPLKSFDILKRNGSLRRRVVSKGRRYCIGFRTLVPSLLVDFEWSTANDFDVRLVEPKGFEINRFGPSTVSRNGGKLIFDVGGVLCQAEFAREQILYLRERSVVEPGTYTIRVNHLRKCSPVSRYNLRVYHNGRVLLNELGTLSEMGENVLVRTFHIPS